jgi:hypothetical protein
MGPRVKSEDDNEGAKRRSDDLVSAIGATGFEEGDGVGVDDRL